jgi:hypothetical protein
MSDEAHSEASATDPPPAGPQGTRWPPLPEPFDVPHMTMSGGLFGGFDVIRSEYIDRSGPRRGRLYRLLHRRNRESVSTKRSPA